MKKRMIATLVCSLILTITLVCFTVFSVVGKKDTPDDDGEEIGEVSDIEVPTDINDERDGTAEKPIYVYDAESFIKKIGGDTEGLYYEVYKDIDFTGIDYTPLFNKGTGFNGHLNGAEHSLKNISIHVTKDNYVEKFCEIYKDENTPTIETNVGLFGELNGAEIKNLTVKSMSIVVDENVIAGIMNSEFMVEDVKPVIKDFTIGIVAGSANESTINVSVEKSTISADAYSVKSEEQVVQDNAIGGIVGTATKTQISGEKVELAISTLATKTEDETPVTLGKNYYIGGVAGYLISGSASVKNVTLEVKTSFEKELYIGGVVGSATASSINTPVGESADESTVSLKVLEVGERIAEEQIDISKDKFMVAGVVCSIFVKDTETKTKATNIKVYADVDIDCAFAGYVYKVFNKTEETSGTNVEFENVLIDAKVNVLKAAGMSWNFALTSVKIEDSAKIADATFGKDFNIRILGNVKCKSTKTYVATEIASTTKGNGYNRSDLKTTVKYIVSKDVFDELTQVDKLNFNGFVIDGENLYEVVKITKISYELKIVK